MGRAGTLAGLCRSAARAPACVLLLDGSPWQPATLAAAGRQHTRFRCPAGPSDACSLTGSWLGPDPAAAAPPFPGRYWFLTDVYPQASGRHVVRTPAWLSRLCLQYGIGRVPIQAVNPVNPSDVGFRAFSGRGRRLGD